MTTATAVPASVSGLTAKSGLVVTDSLKMNANMIYGQGTQVYPAKSGAVYKGDITILDQHVLQEIGKNSVIVHDKSKLNYASDEFKKTAETLRRPDVAIYYQDDNKNPTDTAKVFPFSPAKDDLERVVAGLKKSAKELGLSDMDNVLDTLAGRSWARNQEVRKNIKDEKTAAKEAKTASTPTTQAMPTTSAEPEQKAPKR